VELTWVVLVVVEELVTACWRSCRLNTISPRPMTQTASRIEYQPIGVRCL
jgi:hypothetical protein